MHAWMIRAGRNGVFAEQWIENNTITIWWELDGLNPNGASRETIKERYASLYPEAKSQETAMAAGQIFRYANEMKTGDTIIMYNPHTRIYHLAKVAGDCEIGNETDEGTEYIRKVDWEKQVPRDRLSSQTKNSLGAILAFFSVAESTLNELLYVAENPLEKNTSNINEEETTTEIRYATAQDGIERIKDKVLSLDWDEMEQLVAGLLRAMGYKTSMTQRGADGGRDIIASPDGIGLESPCIVVEVKHRRNAMGAPDLRAFIGGLRSSESGLYVSTGGFTKEARYEADRATLPLRILDLDQFVRLLVENYDAADTETRAILPLIRMYWPA